MVGSIITGSFLSFFFSFFAFLLFEGIEYIYNHFWSLKSKVSASPTPFVFVFS